jgi:hypothetical protein
MTHDKIVTFWLAATWNAVKASWRSRNKHQGRHRMEYIGTKAGLWAEDLVWSLRAERALTGHA